MLDGPKSLVMEGELTIYTALDKKAAILSHLKSGKKLEVDLSKISEIDAAGIQLMILAKREAHVAGKELNFVVNSNIEQTLELARLTEPLLGKGPMNSRLFGAAS